MNSKIVFNGGIKLDKLLFIGIILNYFLNHHVIFFYHKIVCLNFCIVTIVLFISSYYDLKLKIIPNKLSFFLIIYELVFNMVLALMFHDITIFLFSIFISFIFTIFAYVLWYMGFWGGGDFKIFIALSLSVSFLDYFKSNIFNFTLINSNLNHLIFLKNLNLAIFHQHIFYPKIFSILINSISVAFAFAFLMLLCHLILNGNFKYSFLSIMNLNFNQLFDKLNRKTINIKDLKEGMILDNYYFKESEVFNIINSKKKSADDLEFNLNAFAEDELYYFNSLNRIGLTKEDINLINQFYEDGLIKSSDFRIKVSIPFMPFIASGYLIFLIFGDLIYLISIFLKALM